MRASPGPGSAVGWSATDRTSGPPKAVAITTDAMLGTNARALPLIPPGNQGPGPVEGPVGAHDEVGAGVERQGGAVNLQIEQVGVVDADAVEAPYVVRAGVVDLGQKLPGGRRVDVLDVGRLGDAGLPWPEEAHPQYVWPAPEGRGTGPAEDDRARGERLVHDGLGMLAEERGVIRWRDSFGRSSVGAGAEQPAGQRREQSQDPVDQRAPDLPALGLGDGHLEQRGDPRADRPVENGQPQSLGDLRGDNTSASAVAG